METPGGYEPHLDFDLQKNTGFKHPTIINQNYDFHNVSTPTIESFISYRSGWAADEYKH